MLYLKNTLGGLSRSLTESALHTFQGPHRWWKFVLYAILFALPGGSLGVMFFAWLDRRGRGARQPDQAVPAAAFSSAAIAAKTPAASTGGAPVHAAACQPRGDAPACRAAAGKQARQTTADLRV